MRKLRTLVFGAVAGALALTAQAKAEWPEKPIQFIIPFGAGGGADIEGRLIAKAMSSVLGQPVVPVNKPGGGGAITYTFVKNSSKLNAKWLWQFKIRFLNIWRKFFHFRHYGKSQCYSTNITFFLCFS